MHSLCINWAICIGWQLAQNEPSYSTRDRLYETHFALYWRQYACRSAVHWLFGF